MSFDSNSIPTDKIDSFGLQKKKKNIASKSNKLILFIQWEWALVLEILIFFGRSHSNEMNHINVWLFTL